MDIQSLTPRFMIKAAIKTPAKGNTMSQITNFSIVDGAPERGVYLTSLTMQNDGTLAEAASAALS
ncbi:hypothetical protein GGE15_004299 [Rhizobium esperanzae]|uniref:Uncharacterized protein n=1 Tax=Rhizobium esperanzae TaxID=1967781 RepID=A0A7W6XYI0_9HYPH|nr:hypothetical protein [Rhizobium esperanzae]